jgi:quinol monooxygenase YgiN
MNLSELDELMRTMDMPVRPETLETAWELTEVKERARQVLIVVTLRARAGVEGRLEKASREFVAASGGLTGSRGSTLHRSAEDPRMFYLVERFATEDAFARHMASDYFARFQAEQAPLLAEPVTAFFLERGVS